MVFVWQNRVNGKIKCDLWLLLAPYNKAYGQKDKRWAERYTIVQSWTSTIIWDKYNVIWIFLVNYVSGTLWCSRIWNSILSCHGQSLTLNYCCSTECTNSMYNTPLQREIHSLQCYSHRTLYLFANHKRALFESALNPCRLNINEFTCCYDLPFSDTHQTAPDCWFESDSFHV